ncbi:hypothetical protein HD599_001340 [Conyzicola lurida]|uniref:Uncharacterized protein n=1 Tax=Conyzicola lurida TaxID=1172621 RepID=A0A841AIF6_9MICO|nr:hypothetical protein [Conyzicola lurida]MBB5843017.1 hypothetical protein [Conyzicola lurida]
MTPVVVAVFGSNSPLAVELEAARFLAAAIAAEGATLLTGGDGSDPSTVKDAAIIMAKTIPDASWIGVLNEPETADPVVVGSYGLLVTPGFGHRRNFVEACLCDAAVAIGHSPGTSSEALFAMFLRRPVVLVDADPVEMPDLRRIALDRVPKPHNPATALDRGIAHAYHWAKTSDHTPERRRLPLDAWQAAGLVRGLIDGTVPGGLDPTAPRTAADWDALVGGVLHSL